MVIVDLCACIYKVENPKDNSYEVQMMTIMINYQDNEETSNFFYQDLFRIYKKITKEVSKLE